MSLFAAGSSKRNPDSPTLIGAAWVVTTLLAIAIACLLFLGSWPGLIWDSKAYWRFALQLSEVGLGKWHNPLRTYGYPLFIALVTRGRALCPHGTRLSVFAAQLVIFLAACGFVAAVFGRLFGSSRLARVLYALTVLNPFLLSHVTECLSDSLSATLVYLGAALCLAASGSGLARGRLALPAAVFTIALATMVRPANVVVLIGVFLAVLWHRRLWGTPRLPEMVALAAVAAIVFFPQISGNYRAVRRLLPLPSQSYYRVQQARGAAALKYATLVEPGFRPQMPYINPLGAGAFTLTLGLHGFAMLDHDELFTYVTDRSPAYRWPLSVGNYLFLFFAGTGLLRAWREIREGTLSPEQRYAVGVFSLLTALYVAVYLPIAVENRYALPADLMLSPFAARSLLATREAWLAGRARTLIRPAIAAVVFVGFSALLSAWIAQQRRVTPSSSVTEDVGEIPPIPPAIAPPGAAATRVAVAGEMPRKDP